MSAFDELKRLRGSLSDVTLNQLFAEDPQRARRYARTLGPLYVDFSKHWLTDGVFGGLLDLAEARGVLARRDAMFRGEKINATERRAVLHMALRAKGGARIEVDGEDVIEHVVDARKRMAQRARWMRASDSGIDAVLHIGIGGSELGPRLAVDTLGDGRLDIRFLANVDGAAFLRATQGLDPARTAAIVVSKSFTTLETKYNLETVLDWYAAAGVAPGDKLTAVTANVDAAKKAGVGEHAILPMWHWVGGRFSLWSAVGLPIMAAAGSEAFDELLAGARFIDHHFKSAAPEDNLPLILGLLDVWLINFWNAETRAVLAYDHRLKLLPDFLQQLEMESNGKRVTLDGEAVGAATAPIIWGGECTNGQHAYFQLIHQSERLIPTEFIAAITPDHDLAKHHRALLANAVAQSEALMRGQSRDAALKVMVEGGTADDEARRLAPHKEFPGNKPSTTILLDRLSAEALGALIALYEHRVFVQGAVWGINSFDQWGVELGKTLAATIEDELASDRSGDHDSSTEALIKRIREKGAQ